MTQLMMRKQLIQTNMAVIPFIFIIVVASLPLTFPAHVAAPGIVCPKGCTCSYKVVDCSHAGLRVPPILPVSTEVLNLDNNHLESLTKDSFHNMTNLRHLSLQHCHLTNIHHQVFRGMNNLLTLIISKNMLADLPDDTFADQVQLENLVLSANLLNLSSIGRAISTLPNLQLLDIGNNLLDGDILPNEFGNLKALQSLILHNIVMTYLPGNFFHALENTSLNTLRLSGELYNISRDFLSPLTSLQNLDISNSLMTSFDAGNLIHGLRNATTLHTLNMDDVFNKLKTNSTIHNHFFQYLNNTELSVLYFRKNYHAFNSILQHRLFKHLHKLIALYLDSCALITIHSDAFVGLNKLTVLSLKGNLLNCYDKPSCGFLSVKGHKRFSSLLTLDLSDNNMAVSKYSSSFNGSVFVSLQHLYLSNNKLTRLQTGMFTGLTNLRVLDLSRNPIAVVESRSFTGLSNMQTLWINRTGVLNNIPAQMCQGCHELQLLDMSMGDISNVNPLAFKGLKKLQYLTLRDNYLHSNGSLYNVTIESPVLWKLDLGENKLTSIPELVTTSLGLKQLFLDMNYLTDESLSCLAINSALEVLDLSYNAITHVVESFIRTHPNIQKLLMENNPFMCDCDFHNMGDDLKHSNISIVRMENHKCVGPSTIKGHNIFTFSPSKLECGAKDEIIPLICVLLTLSLLVIVCVIKRCRCERPCVVNESCNLDYCYTRLMLKTSDTAFLGEDDSPL